MEASKDGRGSRPRECVAWKLRTRDHINSLLCTARLRACGGKGATRRSTWRILSVHGSLWPSYSKYFLVETTMQWPRGIPGRAGRRGKRMHRIEARRNTLTAPEAPLVREARTPRRWKDHVARAKKKLCPVNRENIGERQRSRRGTEVPEIHVGAMRGAHASTPCLLAIPIAVPELE